MFTDRSRILAYQQCPRMRFLNYHAHDHGITKNKLSIPLASGTYIHMGLAALLQGSTTDAAVALATEAYWSAANAALGALKTQSDHYLYTIQEQAALTEALVRVYALRGLPALLREYEVIGVETEYQFELAPGIQFMSRLDGELRSREDGEIYVLSFKTDTGSGLDGKIDDARIDLQGLTEPIAYERQHGIRPFGVKMEWLVKGQWKEDKSTGDKRRFQDSFLVRPWMRDGEFAWRYFWPCPGEPHQIAKAGGGTWICKGEQATHGLGPSWRRVNIWEHMLVKDWISDLAHRSRAAAAVDIDDDPFAQILYLPPPIVRTVVDQERALRQIVTQEHHIQAELRAMEVCQTPVDVSFIQHTQACNHIFGSECQFKELCFASNPEVALANALTSDFVPRTPHHEPELVQLEASK
jgi:hypothetical protein